MELEKTYNFVKAEQAMQEFWETEQLFNFDPNRKAPVYSVDTPPPYVSAAHLHVGHAMSYSQAEFIVRYHRMRGANIFYPMGFDDNGLPTERYVEKKYNINKMKTDRKSFIALCLKETEEVAKIYRRLWKRLGFSVDWGLQYSTISPLARTIAQRSFIDLYKKGRVERRDEPVVWCTHCDTALAQAELEDLERKSTLYYIKFAGPSTFLTIATTRPELLPACVALFVNPSDERYKTVRGQLFRVPLSDRLVPVMVDESVNPKFGTGLMMVCTWGDTDDVLKWKKYDLDTRTIISKEGKLNALAGSDLDGKSIEEARREIVSQLAAGGFLEKKKPTEQVLNVHERCGTPIEFLQMPQWFIKIVDRKERYLELGNLLQWYPEFMKVRYEDWVRNLKWDWCISRQRHYGVPFPVWYCNQCQYIILPSDKKLPVDPREEPPPIDSCPKCRSKSVIPEMDVMDTWMTSSLTPLINAKWGEADERMDLIYQMSLRPQAFEITRTWLFYTIVKSEAHTDSLPFHVVMISGWGLDPRGKKMSKSLGNFIDAESVIEKYSADALRFWAAEATLGSNLRYSERDVAAGNRFIIKLWNVFRFAFMYISQLDQVPLLKPTEVSDRGLISLLQRLVRGCTDYFEEYDYAHVKEALEKFFWKTYTDNYLEMVKERLWNPKTETEKDSAVSTLYHSLLTILRLFAPILPHVTEYIYKIGFERLEGDKSIHLAKWPAFDESLLDPEAERIFEAETECLVSIRRAKSIQNLASNARIDKAVVTTSLTNAELIKLAMRDLKSAARASEIIIISTPDKGKTYNVNVVRKL